MLTQYNLKMPHAVYGGENAMDNITAIIKARGAKKVAMFTDKGIEGAGLLALPEEAVKASGAEYYVLDAEKQTEFIHNIQVSLNKMEWLVGALLKMAKLDAHAIDFIKNDIHTSELLEAVKPSVAILLDIHNLTIELKQDCIIHCDKRWTTEALTNIVKNAIEYSPDGSVIEIDSGENSMYSWISVKDSGMGMDKTEYAALFKRFENSTNENGFGIGMPLALSILKGQGGDIDVDFGGKGEGTIFILKFF